MDMKSDMKSDMIEKLQEFEMIFCACHRTQRSQTFSRAIIVSKLLKKWLVDMQPTDSDATKLEKYYSVICEVSYEFKKNRNNGETDITSICHTLNNGLDMYNFFNVERSNITQQISNKLKKLQYKSYTALEEMYELEIDLMDTHIHA